MAGINLIFQAKICYVPALSLEHTLGDGFFGTYNAS